MRPGKVTPPMMRRMEGVFTALIKKKCAVSLRFFDTSQKYMVFHFPIPKLRVSIERIIPKTKLIGGKVESFGAK